MLFSGKEFEVHCASDGETALSEAGRIVPDVVLADVDLPRLNGYAFSVRMKQMPSLAKTPVILMMSRDDVLDAAKAKQAGIIDTIAKPFESQELIGKVKKALTSAPPRLAEPAPRPAPPAAKAPPPPPSPPKPGAAAPPDIFDIIKEAPTRAELKRPQSVPAVDESVFEVEPEVEVEEGPTAEAEKALPVGAKAVEEMRFGLGLAPEPKKAEPEIMSFESFGMEEQAPREYAPPPPKAPEFKAPAAKAPGAARPAQPPTVSEDMVREMLRTVAEEAIAKIVREEVQKIAWEVIPELAEQMIREEIERLKTER